ncbi:MAG: Do family serine endopeptidase [Rhodobacteraceae bacterium]|nr:Do family serine endopeptidase [Paracoccaceae bacterium]
MRTTVKKTGRARLAGLALVAALASSTAIAVIPGVATAEPAGGYADLVQKVAPSVVYIEVTEKAPQQMQMMQGFPFQEFSQQFGIPMPQMPQGNDQQQSQNAPAAHGVGSGFIIDSKGLIVTNNHVVDGATAVKVTLQDGRSFDAKVIGTDPVTDVALIKVDATDPLPAVSFDSSQAIRVGDDVMAVGNPFGLGGTVTTGIISAKARDIGSGAYDNYLQTDAAINKGNSGGPLFDDAGKVVGMNTAILSPSGGSVGIGFAVPSDVVQQVVAQLEHGGKAEHGWLGVQIQAVSPDVAAAIGLDKPEGALVAAVNPDSPAAKAGLKRGDIITAFGGTDIKQLHDLPRAVAMTAPDTATKIDVLRAGKKMELNVSVGLMAPQKA